MFPEIDTGRTKLQMLAWQAKYMAEWHKRGATRNVASLMDISPLASAYSRSLLQIIGFSRIFPRLLNLEWYDRKQEYLGAKDRQGL